MDKVEERQKKIKDILGVVESISTEDLAERMNVTGATSEKISVIWKDVMKLSGTEDVSPWPES